MTWRKSIFCVFLWGLLALTVQAQCPDFTDLTGPNVVCYYGTTGNPNAQTGIVPDRHTVITEQGTDPRTDNLLPLLPDGETAVVKLGNELVGAEAESIVYTFTVDPDHSILLLKFAVVFENPLHSPPHQPRFVMRVLDTNDNLLDPCMEYDVTSSNDIPGFQTFGIVKWRPWTNTGFDLSPYVGQTVKLSFTTYDCTAGGHFGYAYFTASCISNRLELVGCNGDEVTLAAPQGFESYQWNNGATSDTATYSVQGTTVANCQITNVIGCQFMLFGTLSTENSPTQDQTFYDTICEGESYSANGFNLPSNLAPGQHTVFNTYFNVANCTDGITNTLFLTIETRHYHFYDMACEGHDYNAYGFSYTNLQVGNIIDSNVVIIPGRCDSVAVLHLTVAPNFIPPDTISGPSMVCGQSIATYTLQNAAGLIVNWNVPEGVFVFSGQGSSTVTLYFLQNAPAIYNISLTGANGCGSGSAQLTVTVNPSYRFFAKDTVCTGNNYQENGFQLGIQDSVGVFVHTLQDTTTCGCDSIHVVQLMVAPTPEITALADPAVICVGQETELHAVGAQASVTLNSQLPSVHAGDILCTDNSIVHPQDWPCGKVAMGIVFHVDASGEHGWAVGLHDLVNQTTWATSSTIDIPALQNFNKARYAIYDVDGYSNTSQIRQSGGSDEFEAAYSVDFEHGWYLPAAGQAYKLFAELPKVNSSLQLVGGSPFSTDQPWAYWTSSEIGSNKVWVLDSVWRLYYSENYYPHSVRGVRSF